MFPETVQVLVKAMRLQEVGLNALYCSYIEYIVCQYRCEVLNCFRRLLNGLGPSSTSAHKDIYKCVRNGLTDKSLAVRSAAAKVSDMAIFQ